MGDGHDALDAYALALLYQVLVRLIVSGIRLASQAHYSAQFRRKHSRNWLCDYDR